MTNEVNIDKKITIRTGKEDTIPTETQPRQVRRAFLPPKLGNKLRGEKYKSTLKEPILFLMRSNGKMELIENVEDGIFYVDSPDRELSKRKAIILDPAKIYSWEYGAMRWRTYVAFEDEMSCYPVDVVHDSRSFRRIIQAITLNYKDFMEKDPIKIGKMWLLIFVGIAVLVYFLATSGFLDQILHGGKQVAETTIQARQQLP